MINAIITVPESPETSNYTPTSMKDIKVANPAANINLIEPPTANSTGSAGVSYPINIPAGRAGMQPGLGIQYNSGGGNGWLGLGWNINLPSVDIDIQWGSPRYDASVETETYSLQGEQLFPLAHRGTPQPRTAEKTFNLRVEGSFNKIVRHGNSPQNYWWEVTGKMGVKSFYGGTPSTGVIENAVLRSVEGNIAHWALVETRDVNDNFVRYEYEQRQHIGVAGGTVPGKQLYVNRILYTGYGQTQGEYSIRFISETGRPDTQISGNLGFKQVTAELLKRIEIRYKNELIRSYRLEYQTGAFFKSLLKSVAEYDADDVLFHKNEFDYFDDVRVAETYVPYSELKSYGLPDDDLKGGLAVKVGVFNDDMSLLGGTKSKGYGAGVYVGVGAGSNVASKGLSAGANYHYSRSESDGILAFVDINGDGLPDKVFCKNGKMYFRPNIGGENFGEAVQIQGISQFSHSTSNSHNVGVSAYFGPFEIGYTRTIGDGRTNVYFSDFNGDGLIDIAKNGVVYFNRIVNGAPVFSTTSEGTPAPVVGGGSIDPSLLPDFQAEQAEKEAAFPLHDVVRLWEAPLDGTISINAPVNLVKDTSEEALDYTKKDGVNVQIQHKGSVLWQQRIQANDYAVYQPSGVSSINVQKGDRIYFRVQSVFDGAYDLTNWDPEINYTAFSDPKLPLPTTDYNGKRYSRYKASEDFVLYGEQAIAMPYDGYMKLEAPFIKGFTGDTIWIRIEQTDSLGNYLNTVYSQKYAPEEIIHNPVSFPNFRTKRGNLLLFTVEAKTNVLWENISWKPVAEYLSADNPNDIVRDYNNDALIKFAVVPAYQGMTRLQKAAKPLDVKMFQGNVNKDSIRALPLDTLRAFRGDTVKIYPQIIAQSFLMQMPVTSLTMLIRGVENDTIYAPKIINLQREGAMIVNKPDSTVFIPKSDGKLWIEFYVNDNLPDDEAQQAIYRDFLSRMEVKFIINKNILQAQPAVLYGKPDYKFLGAGYRGWGAFGYNGNGNRASQPIDESKLKMPDYKEQKAGDINSYQDIQSVGTLSEGQFIMFSPNAQNAAWTGYDLSTYVSAAQVSSSRMGEKDVQVAPYNLTSEAGGLVAVNKENRSSGNNYSAGASAGIVGGSLGINDGKSRNIIDMLDLNGDRFPDLVTNSRVQYTGFDANLQNKTGPGFIHESTSNGWGVSANGKGEGSKSLNTSKFMGDKPNSAGEVAKRSVSLSGNIGENDDRTECTYMDVNGDGLPDRVYKGGDVSLNLGYSFAQREKWGFSQIRDGSATSIGGGLGVSLWHGSFQAGVGLSKTDNYSHTQLIDVNGDGLPDILHDGQVSLNTGNGFADPIPWNGNLSRIGEGVSTGQSANAGITFGFTLFLIPVKIVVSPSVSANVGLSYEKAQLVDIDGDGYPDYVFSEKEDNMRVQKSTIGRTNLLKSVQRPLGANFTLDYTRMGNTYEQPHSQWVLSEVKLFDGYAGDGVDTIRTAFSYEGNYYDRHERTSYGYKTVKTHQLDENKKIYRTNVSEYANNNYYNKSLLLSQTVVDENGKPYTQTTNKYEFKESRSMVNINANLLNTTSGTATLTVFPALTETQNLFFEGQETAQKTYRETYRYGNYGNITGYTSYGDDDTVSSEITYHELSDKYIVSVPESITVSGNGNAFRQRETGIDNRGRVTQIRQATGSATAVYDFRYDGYGNLEKVTRPANYKGERMWFEYTYDPEVHSYVTKVKDAFGYESSGEYDYRFGTVLKTVDLNGQEMNYIYDAKARVTSIQSPVEKEAGVPFTIAFDYHPEAVTPWALTRHYDRQHPDNFMETALFIDGLGREIQTKKDGSIFNGKGKEDSEVMIVSGKTIYDAFGRAVESYYPITENKGNTGIFNTGKDNITPTKVSYDVLDRTSMTTLPDGAITVQEYGFGNDNAGKLRFKTTTTDPNGNATETYTDIRGKQRAVKAPMDTWTTFIYSPLGELLQSTDPEGNITTHQYDLLGRRISRNHPDAGLTEWKYDAAGNILSQVTPNLRAMNAAINYEYTYNRLDEVKYPQYTYANVRYEYGAPGAGKNRAGRIALIEDATGAQEFEYGMLGEVSKTIRTISVPDRGNFTFVTQSEYDVWNRLLKLTYPDGEEVNYTYNLGGLLQKMDGKFAGNDYIYITQLGYDKFESRLYMGYGNGTEMTYAYEPDRRRLQNLTAITSKNRSIMKNTYAYDAVDNITSLTNAAATANANQHGGPASYTYMYDDLYRLISSTGRFESGNQQTHTYEFAMQYSPSGNILKKDQLHQIKGNTQQKTSYNFIYSYTGAKPHAATEIGDKRYTYDANGNPILIENTAASGQVHRLAWDEENRLLAFADNGKSYHYMYDAGGERVLKGKGDGMFVTVNGFNPGIGFNGNYTMYVNAYTVVNGPRYTKHFYIENQRIASKVGERSIEKEQAELSIPKAGSGIDNNGNNGNNGNGNNGKVDYGKKHKFTKEALYAAYEAAGRQPYIPPAGNGRIPYGQLKKYFEGDWNNGGGGGNGSGGEVGKYENLQFFYHPDHLGSSNYITDVTGEVYQHNEYFPYGETFVEERNDAEYTTYLFSGKELDTETGLYYFGARYMDPRTSVFLNIDPLMDKYPGISGYAYCNNNPVRFIDPNGMEIYYDTDGTKLGQVGDNNDVRIINSSISRSDAMTHISSGSAESMAALMGNSTAFADYFTTVNDVTNNAALVPYDPDIKGGCFAAAKTQMENAGFSVQGPGSAINTVVNDVLNPNMQENAIGGAIKIQTDLINGRPVMVGVEQSNDKGEIGYVMSNDNKSTSHFVVIRSSKAENGVVSFNYLDNGTRSGKSSANNLTLDMSTGAISGRMEKRSVNYQISEVRKSTKIKQ